MSSTNTTSKHFEVYSTGMCTYCKQAKRLILEKGDTYVEYFIERDAESKARMYEKFPDAKTVPQIFLGDTHIGGFKELVEHYQ